MALHFVTTAVLTADNAGQFNKEVLTEEGEKIKEKAANSSKPLFMQLADQEALKQEQYDANAKLLRSGPRGLDDEEFDWVNQCQDEVDQLDARRREQEKNELQVFKTNRGRAQTHKPVNNTSSKTSSSSSSSGASRPKAALPAVVAVVKKRRIEATATNTDGAAASSVAKVSRAGDGLSAPVVVSVAKQSPVVSASGGSQNKSASSLLAQYSDSDSD